MKSRGWFKCANRGYIRLWSIALLLCTTASRTILAGIDAIQKRFLRECCLTEEDALMFFSLAPLETRRDIADSPDGSWMRPETLREHVPTRATIDLRNTVGTSSHTVVLEIFRNWSVPHWVSQILRAPQQSMPLGIQSSEQGRRLTAHLFTSHLSLWTSAAPFLLTLL